MAEEQVAEEQVALYDEAGNPSGTAPRSVMRATNLRHGATGILVRNSAGDVYIHQRTPIKDVYPSRWDFVAGGVMSAGEQPDAAAARELGEELGIRGIPLQPVGVADYADDHTTCHTFLYTCTWDGPIVHQVEEVARGEWVTPAELRDRVAADVDAFMPDSVGLWDLETLSTKS